jgi:heme/copper-type cytochrome/quinol oxidase subunit 1
MSAISPTTTHGGGHDHAGDNNGGGGGDDGDGHAHGHGHGGGSADHAHAHHELGFLKKYIFSCDHKIIGIQFLFMGLMFFVLGGLLAMLIRWQMAWPEELQTGEHGHPVPILAKTLWAKQDATKELGSGITAIDVQNKTVTIGGVASSDTGRGDTVYLKSTSGEDLGQARFVDRDGREAVYKLEGDTPKSIKVGDKAYGKRVPGVMPSDFYTMVFSMHATIMIFFVIIPLLVGVFGNYLIPLKIGAGDMAFPFLNGLAFWSAVPAAAIMMSGFFMKGGAAAAGWTSYPPLSAIQQTEHPWDSNSWLAKQEPQGMLEHVGAALRIHGKIVDFEDAKYDAANKTYTVALPPHVSERLRDKSSSAASAAVNEFKKTAPSDRKNASVSIKDERLVFSNVDEETGRTLAHMAQQRMSWQGTWSDASVITGYLAMFMMCGFICAYFMRFDSHAANVVVGVALSLVGGYLINKGAQYAAFDGQSAWFFALIWLGFSSLMGGINYLTTIIKLRCPGMTMFRMPLSVWSLFITSLLVVLATPVLASALGLNLLDHHRLTSFFLPMNWTRTNQIQAFNIAGVQSTLAGGGYPIMHQHLFWFYSHPAVYIMILPAMGMVSDVLAVFARKPIFGYRPMVYAMAGIAFLGFIVWAHHMFQSGMNPTLGTTFAISTMFIAVPSAIKTFNWLGTLWRGNIRFATPMLNALAFVSMFVIGGLSGIFMASTAVDVHIHDTYFIVAHIHYVLFGGSTFGIFAGIYFWYPKMFGRMMNETLGKIHFWLSFIAFNCTFFAMHILGMRGMPRRIAGYLNYDSFADLRPMNVFITISAFVLGLAQIPFVINFIGSWIWGKRAPQNPWEATTLEWVAAPTPPPHGNFAQVPVVYHGPYEYSSPLVEEDYLPQTRYVEGAEELVAKGH